MKLVVPLTQSQVDAAQRLHGNMRQWLETDAALSLIAQRFNGFDYTSTLVKVVSVNGLYGTNLYAVHRMTAHITRVMASSDASTSSVDLVERMGSLTVRKAGSKPRRHLSFASKFCHFFIDPDRFPIMDSFATLALKRHLGTKAMIRDDAAPYRAFTQNVTALIELSGVQASVRQLDRYLWISGAYHALRRKPTTLVNAELAGILRDPLLEADRAALVGVQQLPQRSARNGRRRP
jgi:hypothetical protein